MDADLDTLATALNVTADDLLKAEPEQLPSRPVSGFQPVITDAELITLAVIQALLQIPKERHFLRYARTHLRTMFPELPSQSAYNRRLRALAHTMAWLTARLAATTSVYTDDLWVVDSTPVECARSRETVGGSGCRMGRIRLLRVTFALLLGTTPAPDRDPPRPTDRVGTGRRESRRT